MTAAGIRRAALVSALATVAVTCVALGFWQLDRHQQLLRRNALLEERLAAGPLPYDEGVVGLDPDASLGADADATHRPVRAEGRFDARHEVLLRSRSLEGRPGHHVITPLVLDAPDGAARRAVLVDRGWIPFAPDPGSRVAHDPPEGRVRVTGRLAPEEDPPEGPLASLAPRDPPEGRLATVARIDVDRLGPQMPYALEPFVIHAEQVAPAGQGETPEAAGDAAGSAAASGAGRGAEGRRYPIVPPPPRPESGPHLGYALQWFAFAAIAVIGPLVLARRGRDATRRGRGAARRHDGRS